jgi:signal transduction histidine kinase/ActR/RegA family two-component response regulator
LALVVKIGSALTAKQIAEAARNNLQTLATASAQLSKSLEEGATLEVIGAAMVPRVADLCRIDLVDAQGVLQRKLTCHVDPERVAAIDRVVRSGAASADTPGSFPWAIATGETFMRNDGDPGSIAVDDPAFTEFAHVVGMRAICVVPLVARGHTIGVMAAIQAESGRQFSNEDVALISELGQRAALALDNVRLFTEYRTALDHAHAASKTKDDFLAMLGHELRNPLAPIVAALELIRRREPQAALRERQIIERQVKHLSRLVDDLLDISRIVSGRIQLGFESVDLADVVQRALEINHPLLEKRHSMPVVMPPPAAVHVRGDPVRLAQVIGNLLNNAAKFTPSDKGITIEWQRADDQARIVVQDQGAGMPADLLPTVFERFVQGAQTFARSQGGLGLGLAIARSLVELHGGSIRAESDGPGLGSRFTVTLPAIDMPGAPLLLSPLGGEVLMTSHAARLLLVDDNVDAADMLASILRLDGYEVRTAASGEEALQVVAGYAPDAAILDLGLPGMSGFELARALRLAPSTRSILMVALTGYGQASDREQALSAGFDEHMVKPAPVSALRARLAQYFQAAASS